MQFRHQPQTGESELDEEFHDCWDLAETGREQFYADWEAAQDEIEIAPQEQEHLDYCRHRPASDKNGDKRMYLPGKRSEL